jgi:hypothetical protein
MTRIVRELEITSITWTVDEFVLVHRPLLQLHETWRPYLIDRWKLLYALWLDQQCSI